MTVTDAQPLSAEEQEQLRQTIEMFEVITQANPQDTQSLEILKEAYARSGMVNEALDISRKLADSYLALSQYSSALLEYESILQKRPDDAEVIAALGDIETRLRAIQEEAAAKGGEAPISLDFRSVVQDSGNLIATNKTLVAERPLQFANLDSAAVAQKLEHADDGNDALVRFLVQHKLVSQDTASQALAVVRKKNGSRTQQQVAMSLIDEIVTRGSVNLEQLLAGILDRSKFAYIPLEYYEIDRQVVKMLPDSLTLGRLMVPFDVLSRTMMVAVANPFDAVGKETVQQLLDYNIQWHLASPSAIMKVLADIYRL